MRALAARLARQKLGAVVVLAGLTSYFAAVQDGFLDPYNLLSLARQYSELGLVAVGMTLVIATGGIDISVGGTVGMTSMLTGLIAVKLGLGMGAAVPVALAAAALVGALNGYAIAYLRMQPVLVTLATMSLTRGIAYIATSGVSLSGFPAGFTALASTDFPISGLRVPLPALVTALTFAAAAVAMRRTSFGRAIIAIGQSEEAARLSGIGVRRTKFTAYFVLSLLAGVAGLMLTSRVSTAFPDAGRNYEFEAITAVVLGGTSLSGGEGSLLGTLAGVCTMAVLRNGMSLAGQSDLTRTQMLAVALIAAVLIDNLRRKLAQG